MGPIKEPLKEYQVPKCGIINGSGNQVSQLSNGVNGAGSTLITVPTATLLPKGGIDISSMGAVEIEGNHHAITGEVIQTIASLNSIPTTTITRNEDGTSSHRQILGSETNNNEQLHSFSSDFCVNTTPTGSHPGVLAGTCTLGGDQ